MVDFLLETLWLEMFSGNGFGFPLKIIAFKNGYPTLNYSYDKIKKTALIEIIKSSIGDSITLYLIYNFPFSPLKI